MTKLTPEDLIHAVIAADTHRRKLGGQCPLNPSGRANPVVAFLFNFLGWAWGWVTSILPWPWSKRYVQWVISQMAGRPFQKNPTIAARTDETIHLARQLRDETGSWPALLVAMTHPETEGPWQWLRFEMMGQGLRLAEAFVEARAPGKWFYAAPRCLLAIDPFALDTVGATAGSFYAAWMHQTNIAYDRQPSAQGWWQKYFFLRKSSYAYIGWKLLRYLHTNVPVLMAFGGGLPSNARLLYGVREFVHELKISRWHVSKRVAQIELMNILKDGVITPREKDHMRGSFQTWGLPAGEVESALDKLDEEFKLPVPYRTRLLRILARSLAKHQKPLLIVPLSHQEVAPYVVAHAPVVLSGKTTDFEGIGKNLANIFVSSVSNK